MFLCRSFSNRGSVIKLNKIKLMYDVEYREDFRLSPNSLKGFQVGVILIAENDSGQNILSICF